MQLLLFSALSVGSLLIFRGRLLKWLQADPQAPPVDTLVGEIGTAAEDLLAGSVGRVELRGTAWSGAQQHRRDARARRALPGDSRRRSDA